MKKILILLSILSLSASASMLYKIDDGIKFYSSSNYKNALEYFKNYVKSNPDDEDGYFWLAKSYSAENDNKNAAINFKKAYAIALNDKNIDKIEFENNEYDNLEDYFDMTAMFYEQKNYKEALSYADMMLKIDPDCADAYFLKAKIAYDTNDKIHSIQYMNKAIIYNEKLTRTKLAKNLGIVKLPELSQEERLMYAQKFYYKGDVDSSIGHLKKYIESDKTNIDAYVLLINSYLKKLDIENAKIICSEAQKLFDNNLSLMLLDADIAYFEHDHKYKDILLKIYEKNPNNKKVLLKLGNYYLDNKNYEEAKKYFEILINVDETLYEAYFGYIYSLIRLGDYTNAQNYVRQMTSISEQNGEALYLLSLICSANKEYNDALNYISDAIKKEKNPKYFFEAGKLNYILNNNEASIKNLENDYQSKLSQEYLILNYLSLNDLNRVEGIVLSSAGLDKKRIMYKYYLYKIYKSDSNVELNSILKQRPFSMEDYIDLIRINALENNLDNAFKILKSASKKFNKNPEMKYFEQEFTYKYNSPTG